MTTMNYYMSTKKVQPEYNIMFDDEDKSREWIAAKYQWDQ